MNDAHKGQTMTTITPTLTEHQADYVHQQVNAALEAIRIHEAHEGDCAYTIEQVRLALTPVVGEHLGQRFARRISTYRRRARSVYLATRSGHTARAEVRNAAGQARENLKQLLHHVTGAR